jgi:ATP:cob(I)alamin adenosyltransferase
MAIYTKKGDKGETGLFDKKKGRVSKDSLRVEAIGAIDELNSFLGVCTSFSESPKMTFLVKEIQGDLLTIGSITAGSKLGFFKNKTNRLEKIIDEIDAKLPPLANFVVPGGTRLASHFQYARSLSRRAERRMVALSKEEKIRAQILTYLNRLSDALFMLAREANFKDGVKDEVWRGQKS